MVNLLYLIVPVCRDAELSGLRGVARRRGGEASGDNHAGSAAQDRFFEGSER